VYTHKLDLQSKEGAMNNTEQQFLKELDDKLWKAADKLRANLDAANYKHVVLGCHLFCQGIPTGCCPVALPLVS
jgi:hypothetical protein